MTTTAFEFTNIVARLGDSIRCGMCGRRATLRSLGHDGCANGPNGERPPHYKCRPCWNAWMAREVRPNLRAYGHVTCKTCRQQFGRVKVFANYEAF